MMKPHHIMVEPHYIMIKPHHIITKPHHIMTKPHHIMTKPHHIMTKPHHIMMYQNCSMTKLHHITTKRQHIMTIDHIRKLWLSIFTKMKSNLVKRRDNGQISQCLTSCPQQIAVSFHVWLFHFSFVFLVVSATLVKVTLR